MKKQIFFIVFFMLLAQSVFAQVKTDSIEIRKRWYGFRFRHDGEKVLSMRKLSEIIRPDPSAYLVLKRARHFRAVGLGFAIAGYTVFIAHDVYMFARDKYTTSNTIFYVGAGVVLLGLPFNIASYHIQMKAIRKYNSDIRKTSYNERKPEFYLGFSGTAIGIGLKF